MKLIDTGHPLRIAVEDYSYGIDELFYQDATNSGIRAIIEDGVEDGDEAIDIYLIPTFNGESVQDVLSRYFPNETDEDGNLISIWSSELRADEPEWCDQPATLGSIVWCRHSVSAADWWNIYTSGLGDGTKDLKDTVATKGSTVLLRINRDSDSDGYSDRSELKLATDPDSPTSHPNPMLIAGVHPIQIQADVTSTLTVMNIGRYEAYGVEAVVIAPDESISITNNVVGGGGHVRALKQVIVGSKIALQSPLLGSWSQQDHAHPAIAGYYSGQTDRNYTLTVNCSNPGGCQVGTGTWNLAWDDGKGLSGTINFGAGYDSPLFLNLGSHGVTLSMYTGKVFNGETFEVSALTPRDTFQYHINYEPHAEPIVVVSYNDPQGNHRFVTPVNLPSPTTDLVPYATEMLGGIGVDLSTSQPVTMGQNTTSLVVSNPTTKTIVNSHLFLEFVDVTGTVASEVPITVTLNPGPTVVPVSWNTGALAPHTQWTRIIQCLSFGRTTKAISSIQGVDCYRVSRLTRSPA